MKLRIDDRQLKIFQMLKSGKSGQEIAEELGLSRTAIWKFVKKLEEMGYVFEHKRGVGYRLIRSPDLSIFEVASVCCEYDLIEEVYYYKKVDSTNQRAKEAGLPNRLFIAEEQTKGRGRFGRSWLSEFGGLYFSITLPRILPIEDVPKITLTTGLAVAKALNAKVKWPNDVLYNGKKLCGILCELAGEVENPLVIVGIGVNVNNPTPEVGISLKEIHKRKFSRIDVFKVVFGSFVRYYNLLLNGGWDKIREEFIELCDTMGKFVKVRVADRIYEGLAVGIDENGGLLLKTDNSVKRIFSGECFYVNQ